MRASRQQIPLAPFAGNPSFTMMLALSTLAVVLIGNVTGNPMQHAPNEGDTSVAAGKVVTCGAMHVLGRNRSACICVCV